MSFTLPNFNLTCKLYTGGVVPGGLRVSPKCNLCFGRRVPIQWWDWEFTGQPAIWMHLLLPPLTDIRGFSATTGSDACEVPAGSGRLYTVAFVDDIGKGFANEHRFALLDQLLPMPTPLP